jgi:hypothetical protein
MKPQAMAYTCNPNYSEDRDQEDCGSWPAQTKKLLRSLLNKQNLGVVVYICHPSYMGVIIL